MNTGEVRWRVTDRHTHRTTTVTLAAHARRGLMKVQTLGELRMRDKAIDGLDYFYSCSPASSSRRVWHGLATVVDSMRESIHAIRCDFLSPQGTQSEQIWSCKPRAIMHIGFSACLHGISLEHGRFRKIALLFSGLCSSEAVGIANGQPRIL